MSLLLFRGMLKPAEPPPARLRGRKGIRNLIYERVPQYEKHTREWWRVVLNDILDNHWE
jgi:hypothetical protein